MVSTSRSGKGVPEIGITHTFFSCFAHVTALRFSARLIEGSSEVKLASVKSLTKSSGKPYSKQLANSFAP
jgi:hypothetical protein